MSLKKIPLDQSVIKKKTLKLNITEKINLRACNTNARVREENNTDPKDRKNPGFKEY